LDPEWCVPATHICVLQTNSSGSDNDSFWIRSDVFLWLISVCHRPTVQAQTMTHFGSGVMCSCDSDLCVTDQQFLGTQCSFSSWLLLGLPTVQDIPYCYWVTFIAVTTKAHHWTLSWGKIKLSLCLTKYHAMKTNWESAGIAPLILNLGTRRGRVISFTPRLLYTRYKLDWRLGGPTAGLTFS